MRIANQKFTVRSIIFSKPAGFLYFCIFVFFSYKSFSLLPIWSSTKYKAEKASVFYAKKQQEIEAINEDLENKKTNLGQERYQKDFFNKLEAGEHLIILYKEKNEERIVNQEERRMFWWEEVKQNFLVWWRNLDISKK